MDSKELEKWLETDEGRNWIEAQKKPLLDNRDSILGELKAANGKLSALGQRLSETENTLQSERAVTSKYLIDNDLIALLRKANVFEVAIPHTLETLKAAYSLSVKADGDNRKAIGVLKDEKGNDIEAGLSDVLADWVAKPLSKCFIQNRNAGGGALGSGFGLYTAPISSALRNISGPELAKMSDNEFTNLREQIQTNRGEN
jgi:hypothetical protein